MWIRPWQLITLKKRKVANLYIQYKKYGRLVTEATEEQKEYVTDVKISLCKNEHYSRRVK